MYLFDPDTGDERRQFLADKANDAARRTGGALSTSWHTMRDKANEYSQAAVKGANKLSGNIFSTAEHARKRLADTGDYFSGRFGRSASQWGSHLGKRAQKLGRQTSRRFWSAMPGRFGGSPTTSTMIGWGLAGIGCAAAGAGVMYLTDPVAGRRRRAMIRDKFISGYGKMAHSIDKTSRYMWGHIAGAFHEVRGRFSHPRVDDHVLVERIRSQIGRCVQNPSSIEVCADSGRVTISGPVQRDEVDGLLKCVWSTRGVHELINQLDVQGREQARGEQKPDSPAFAPTPTYRKPSPRNSGEWAG
jgi:hypothetical protein